MYQANNWKLWLGAVLVFLAGGVLGWFGARVFSSQTNAPAALREGGYKYINPILLCNANTSASRANEDLSLENKIKQRVLSSPNDVISVYYLNPISGKFAGVNESETFSPASMLKVPLMVAALKYAESHADFLSQSTYYDGSFNDNKSQYFKSKNVIQPGHSYTMDQLLTYMIADSDNNAVRLLSQSIDPHALDAIFINLGIQLPALPEDIDFMSPKTYSLFLRILYNSTYLSRGFSEKAISLMTTPDFPQGLQAGIPPTIAAAQKFGERQVLNSDKTVAERELHDCGIIYPHGDPYTICVMTRGNDFDSLTKNISDISKIVYDHVSTKGE